MELIGKKVIHGKYGDGLITNQSDAYVYVKFSTQEEIKTFPYPSSLGTFLTLCDTDMAERIEQVKKEGEMREAEKKAKLKKESNERYINEKLQVVTTAGNYMSVSPFHSVNEFCNKSKDAISAEIDYLRANGGKRYHIYDGERIETNDRRYIYSFETDSELHLPDETMIILWLQEVNYPGNVIACEDYNIMFSTNEDFGEHVSEMKLSAEPWQLLEALIERLDEMNELPSPAVKMLVCDGIKAIDCDGDIIKGQDAALSMATTRPITFVWGPPGTGKTQTLAAIAREHIRRGNRVLMLSYSNVSVDGAISRVYKMAPGSAPGVLVRYGYPRDKDLLNHEYLTSYNLAIQRYPELLRERTALNEERKRVGRASPRRVEIVKRLSQIRDVLKGEEKSIVHNAQFVATTVSKVQIDEAIYSQKFDAVIFDEASMALIPQIVFAASLTRKHFICLGDFCQLPPIVQSSNTSFLNADIFQYCGIVLAVENKWRHDWMCLLDTQYRMHSQIADFVGRNMYHGFLKSARGMDEKRNEIVLSLPMECRALGLVDLTGMMSVCTKTHDSSRINVLSAFIACGLAIEAAANSDVGIITPYNAQSRLIRAMTRDIEEQMTDLHPITCATVHQFQGSEKDIVIYDAVDCYRMTHPGILLTSLNNNYANRLLNVAMTRAKGKFIAIANTAYFENKSLSKRLLFEKLISHLQMSNGYMQGQEIYNPRLVYENQCLYYFDAKIADFIFFADIVKARSEIRIDIPGQLNASDAFISTLCNGLEEAKANGVKIFIRAENKQQLPAQLRRLSIENGFVANPVVVIDKRVVWFGEPPSGDQFISEGNNIETRFRPMIRFFGKYTAKILYGLLELSHTVDQTVVTGVGAIDLSDNFASYISAHKTCSKCGKPMRLIKSKNGKFFMGCTAYPACRNMEYLEPDFVNEYLFQKINGGVRCPQDGAPLEAERGPYGIYVKCYGKARHVFKLDEI